MAVTADAVAEQELAELEETENVIGVGFEPVVEDEYVAVAVAGAGAG